MTNTAATFPVSSPGSIYKQETGHASPKMLKKYIKADSLEVVEKLTDKYEYFR